MRRKNEEPLNLGGLTKSAAAMMAAKHVSALKTTATDNGDGDIEVVGVVPGPGSKMTNIKILICGKLNKIVKDSRTY